MYSSIFAVLLESGRVARRAADGPSKVSVLVDLFFRNPDGRRRGAGQDLSVPAAAGAGLHVCGVDPQHGPPDPDPVQFYFGLGVFFSLVADGSLGLRAVVSSRALNHQIIRAGIPIHHKGQAGGGGFPSG